jgi:hypothetical protein
MSRDAIVEATSKLPFAGRHAVRLHFLNGREAARQGNVQKRVANMAYIGGMVAIHAYTSKLGVDFGLYHAHQGGVPNNIEATYDGIYTTANAMVTYTQLRLFGKLAFTGKSKQDTALENVALSDTNDATPLALPAELNTVDAENTFSDDNLRGDLAFTIGGQALFVATVATYVFH